jgi:triosephosphate isomerase
MKYIVANWKAHFSLEEMQKWLHDFSALPLNKCEGKVEIIICPRRNKLMTECCKHMKILKTTHTLNNCIEIALKYESTSGRQQKFY